METSIGFSNTEFVGDLDNSYLIREWRQWSGWGVLKVIGGENVEPSCLGYSFKKSGHKGGRAKGAEQERAFD